ARLLGRDGEARAVDQVLGLARLQLEGVRQVGRAGGRKVLSRQGRQVEAGPAGLKVQLAVAAGGELDLGAVGQLADDVVERVRRRRGRRRCRDRRLGLLNDGQVHVRGGQAELPVRRLQQDVRQDGNG